MSDQLSLSSQFLAVAIWNLYRLSLSLVLNHEDTQAFATFCRLDGEQESGQNVDSRQTDSPNRIAGSSMLRRIAITCSSFVGTNISRFFRSSNNYMGTHMCNLVKAD